MGRAVIAALRSAKIEVRGLTRRDASTINFPYSKEVEWVEGIIEPKLMSSFLQDLDAVIYTVGPPMKGGWKFEHYQQLIDNVVKGMETHGPNRLISIAGASIVLPEEDLIPKRKLLRGTFKIAFSKLVAIKDYEAQVISSSTLSWTIIRPGFVKKHQSGSFHVHATNFDSASIDRTQLANFFVENLLDEKWERSAPLVWTT